MIISRTPLRISFFSGGSDIPAFHKTRPGAALSVTINKYIYVMVHPHWNNTILTKFDSVEESKDITEVKHLITKNALALHQLDGYLSISSVSDIPTGGSGLGSSSAFTVGLDHILRKMRFTYYDDLPEQLARDACTIEINMCGFPIGKQDQYAAAYGGSNLFIFADDIVGRFEAPIQNEAMLEERLLLFYTGISRNANVILSRQTHNIETNPDVVKLIEKNVQRCFQGGLFLKGGRYDDFGMLLHEAWMDKRQLAEGITSEHIDSIYSTAIKHGALGGKLLGAGGGGFMLFYVPSQEARHNVKEMLESNFPNLKEFPFRFSKEGSKIS